MLSVSVHKLLADSESGLDLELLAGKAGVERMVFTDAFDRPGLVLTGHFSNVNVDRVQILGATEISLLEALGDTACRSGVENLVSAGPACLVVTRGLKVPDDLCEVCDEHDVPLLRTRLNTSVFIYRVERYLEKLLAPTTSLHGVLLDVLGIGVLLLGKSGIGKSEVALDLVLRGHRLVADDIVDIRKKPPSTVVGSGSEIIRHHMEIRGLGIINIKDMFGAAAVRDAKKIELVTELQEWDASQEYDRLGVDEQHHAILGVDVPYLRLPVRPGRSISSLIEVAARNQILKHQGQHSARDFQDHLDRAIARAEPSAAAGSEVE